MQYDNWICNFKPNADFKFKSSVMRYFFNKELSLKMSNKSIGKNLINHLDYAWFLLSTKTITSRTWCWWRRRFMTGNDHISDCTIIHSTSPQSVGQVSYLGVCLLDSTSLSIIRKRPYHLINGSSICWYRDIALLPLHIKRNINFNALERCSSCFIVFTKKSSSLVTPRLDVSNHFFLRLNWNKERPVW